MRGGNNGQILDADPGRHCTGDLVASGAGGHSLADLPYANKALGVKARPQSTADRYERLGRLFHQREPAGTRSTR
jgi:hypothetical protein